MARVENELILRLPRLDRRRLLDASEPFMLSVGDVLAESGKATRHLYFPITGFVSLAGAIDGHAELQVGMVGREGLLGAHLALGVAASPWNAQVQGAGTAWRIGVTAFRREQGRSLALRRRLAGYLHGRIVQLAVSAACQHFHLIRPRLARWLLTTQDCAQADTFRVTHAELAAQLGVRRVGVTMAAGALQRDGLIVYRRGEMTVLDRRGLEAVSCGCYAADRKESLTPIR